MADVWWIVGVFLVSALLTAALWRVAPRLGILALPNARSSHSAPTPSAGGLAFALPMVCWLLFVGEDYPPSVYLAAAGMAIAVLGFVDDLRDIRSSVRLACHLLLVAVGVLWLLEPSVIGAVVLIVALAWWVNLYNFMDGIDGIAASQTLAYTVGALLLGTLHQSQAVVWLLLAAVFGFLLFNWAPAKIFMGDAGSGYLGLTTGVLVLWLDRTGELPFVASCILLLAFWLDATYTLLARVATGQAFTKAHRSHVYQIAAARMGHARTTLLFWLHWLVWLMPLAALSIAFPGWRYPCLAVACLPMVIACVRLGAGQQGAQERKTR